MPRKAFSLLELLVVIAILATLAGLVLAGVQAVRTVAARTDCQNRMRQLGLAAQNHHATHRHFPAGVAYPFATSRYDAETSQSGISWLAALLPYLEQDTLWRQTWEAHTAKPSGNSPAHDAVAAHPVVAFRCPTDTRALGRYHYEPAASEDPPWGLNNYLGIAGTGLHGEDGVFHPNLKVTSTSITDGTSHTIMIGERPTGLHGYGSSWYSGWGPLRYFQGQLMPVNVEWANAPVEQTVCPTVSVFQPGRFNDPCHHHHLWSLHPGGGNFAFADGSVRFLSYSAVSVLPALATRAGGETIGDY